MRLRYYLSKNVNIEREILKAVASGHYFSHLVERGSPLVTKSRGYRGANQHLVTIPQGQGGEVEWISPFPSFCKPTKP